MESKYIEKVERRRSIQSEIWYVVYIGKLLTEMALCIRTFIKMALYFLYNETFLEGTWLFIHIHKF